VSESATPAAPGAAAWKVFLIAALAAAPFVLALSMSKGLSHDEHQHIAAGALLAREGLLPYEDFPHFHTPYLAFIYAAIFRMTDHLLLGARLFSSACAIALVAAVGTVAYGRFRARGARVAALAGGTAVFLAVSAETFTQTTGRAWNQEPAALCALLAFLLQAWALPRASRAGVFGAGLLVGLAVGLRITYAPLGAPFILSLLMANGSAARRWAMFVALGAGAAAGLSGVVWLWARAPEAAFFGNFEFANLNVIYRMDTGEPRTMTLPKKLRYVFKEIARPDAPLVLAFLAALGFAWWSVRSWRGLSVTLRFLLLVLPFLLIGSLAPSPLFEQYFFPFVPFIIVGGALALAAIADTSRGLRAASLIAACAAVLSAILGFRDYHNFHELFHIEKWAPIELHRDAQSLRTSVPAGRVLTLAPLHPLEAGCAIYPSFATGPFAWRISPYLSEEKAARLKIVSPATLAAALANEPPAAVLLGSEEHGEKPLEEYAEALGYQPSGVANDDTLWLPPVAPPANAPGR
jgi:hypothetical protein